MCLFPVTRLLHMLTQHLRAAADLADLDGTILRILGTRFASW